ncbi:MAG: hypothetical protein QXW00_03715 [Candidatus Woesearchaeota archaeon]
MKSSEDKRGEKAEDKVVLCRIIPMSEALARLKESSKFKKWKSLHPNDFLASAFTIMEGKSAEWQFSFYNVEKDSVVSFVVSENEIGMLPESAVLKEPEHRMLEIRDSDIKLDIHGAIEVASKHQTKNYPKEKPIKIIAVLASSEGRNIWSITYLTQNFKTLVMKVDAESGEMLSEKIVSFFSYE